MALFGRKKLAKYLVLFRKNSSKNNEVFPWKSGTELNCNFIEIVLWRR